MRLERWIPESLAQAGLAVRGSGAAVPGLRAGIGAAFAGRSAHAFRTGGRSGANRLASLVGAAGGVSRYESRPSSGAGFLECAGGTCRARWSSSACRSQRARTCETALDQARQWVFSLDRPPARLADEQRGVLLSGGRGSGVHRDRAPDSAPGRGKERPSIRIAILLRDPERYQMLIEEALRRAAIPAYFSRGAQPSGSSRTRVPGVARLRGGGLQRVPVRGVFVAGTGSVRSRSKRRSNGRLRATKYWAFPTQPPSPRMNRKSRS